MFEAGVDLFQCQACKSHQRYRLYERHFAAVHGSEAAGGFKKIRKSRRQTMSWGQAEALFQVRFARRDRELP
jgi:hypothetical protein